MIPALLAQIGLPVLTRLVGQGLGRIDTPATRAAADALGEVSRALDDGRIPPEAVAEANRHVERLAELNSGDYRTAMREVNRTIRVEVESADPYVRRMRPTFGYLMALTWTAQMGAIAYVIVANPGAAAVVIADMASLSVIWTVGLSVLGVYVYKRSQDKHCAATGAAPEPSGLAGLVGRLTGR